MKLFYFKEDDTPNFGDDLNPWLWDRLLPNFFDNESDHLFVGIGTILNQDLPVSSKYTIFGSGYGYGDAPIINNSWNIVFVRGKYTCRQLGIPENKAILDPAYLLKTILTSPMKKIYPLSIIPHAKSLEQGDWQKVAKKLNAHLIDARTTDVEGFVNQIKQSERVLCEAMHGAIIADCFNVPWSAYYSNSFINHDKWNDWLSVFSQKITLQKIDKLEIKYKAIDVIKNKVKRILLHTPFWRKHWIKPESTIETVVNSLNTVIAKNLFFCNKESEIDDKIKLLTDEIINLKQNK